MRLLVTGSRDWRDREIIAKALKSLEAKYDVIDVVVEEFTLIQGNAPGADTIAGNIAMELGWDIEDHPADWGGLGVRAGPIRNQEMVDSGADQCFAFPLPSSKGTYDCIKRARETGIPVTVYSTTGQVVQDRTLF